MIPLDLDWKLIATLGATFFGIASFVPYIIEIFAGKTKPHAYTWLIWGITQGTATFAVFMGGGGDIGYTLVILTTLIFVIFFLSLKYGTKNIKRSDTVALAAALLAVVVWWQLDNPVLAVLMVTAIDGVGYLPTYRKLFGEPWSESFLAWIFCCISYSLSLIALTEYNVLTVSYLLLSLVAGILLLVISFAGRLRIPKPSR